MTRVQKATAVIGMIVVVMGLLFAYSLLTRKGKLALVTLTRKSGETNARPCVPSAAIPFISFTSSPFPETPDPRALALNTAKCIYPSAELTREGSLVFVDGGSAKHISESVPLIQDIVSGDFSAPIQDGWFYASAFDVSEEKEATSQKLRQFEIVPNGAHKSYVVAAFVNRQGSITSGRFGVLDSESPSSQVSAFLVTDDVILRSNNFPVLSVIYTASYSHGDWSGWVEWEARLDTSTMTITERVPRLLVKINRDGQESLEYLKTTRKDAKTVEVTGLSGRSLDYPCGQTCIIDGAVLLEKL